MSCSFDLINLRCFGFKLFVGDLIIKVGLGVFGWCHRTMGPNARGNFLFLSFERC